MLDPGGEKSLRRYCHGVDPVIQTRHLLILFAMTGKGVKLQVPDLEGLSPCLNLKLTER